MPLFSTFTDVERSVEAMVLAAEAGDHDMFMTTFPRAVEGLFGTARQGPLRRLRGFERDSSVKRLEALCNRAEACATGSPLVSGDRAGFNPLIIVGGIQIIIQLVKMFIEWRNKKESEAPGSYAALPDHDS